MLSIKEYEKLIQRLDGHRRVRSGDDKMTVFYDDVISALQKFKVKTSEESQDEIIVKQGEELKQALLEIKLLKDEVNKHGTEAVGRPRKKGKIKSGS